MIRTLDLRAEELADYGQVVPRADVDVDAALDVVRPVCEQVAHHGEAALRGFSERFDGVVPPSFRVPAEVIDEALDSLEPELASALTEAIRRRRAVARAEADLSPVQVGLADGALVEHRIVPVERVGLYVPGGLAPLASSVLMNVVPAQAAGVEEIAVASPPQKEFGGWPHPTVLAVCGLLGVDEVYAVGGAQAVAMYAYGVPDVCPKVDLVTGPGNIYVVAAKRLLRGRIGIDSEAGPTEIGILADDSANPAWVAADLISQAEHDPLAGSVLVTDSEELARGVEAELERQVADAPHRERILTALGGKQSAIVLVRDLLQGLDVVDAYAAEHLEIHTRDADVVAQEVRNAGAIFVGPHSPVSLGDYAAGSTHVLPTGGAARHSSGLDVTSFCRRVHVVRYDRAALAELSDAIQTMAAAENLPGHGAAVRIRFAGDGADATDQPEGQA